MTRVVFVLALVVAVFCCVENVMAAGTQGKLRIAMVLWRGMTPAEHGFQGFLAQKKMDINYIIYDLEGDRSRLPVVIDEIKKSRPDLVYTFGTTVTADVAGTLGKIDPQRHITDIPIVFNIVADPPGSGLVGTGDKTGRNLTGVSHLVPIDVQLKALRQAGDFKQIGVVYNPLERNAVSIVEKLEAAAPHFDMEVLRSPLAIGGDGIPSVDAFPRQLELLAGQGVDLIYLPSDSFLIANAVKLIAPINATRIPTFSATEGPIRLGGALMGIVSHYENVGEFAGFKAWQILAERISPGEIPIETLKRFSTLVNLETSRLIDFYPPVSILKVAEAVR